MESNTKPKFMQLWPQWLAASEVFVLKMVTGMALGWLPPFLGLLRSPISPYEATKNEISWVASLIGFAKPMGVFTGSLAASHFGSKRALNICVFFLLSAYICLFFADKIEVIYITFICKGLNLGAAMATSPIYISEISAANIRGRLISFVTQGLTVGILLGNLMGTYLTPRAYAAICMGTDIFFFVSFSFLPQTAHHMVRCNKMEKAAKSMRWYNRGVDIKMELDDLTEFHDSNPKLPFLLMLKALFKNPVNRKILLKMCIFIFSLQITALSAMREFMVIIFTDARITALKPTTLMTILTLINIPASWIPILIMDKFKRTNIYCTACIIVTLAMIGFASTCTLIDSENANTNTQWIIIMSAILCQIAFTGGFIPFFSIFTSEMFAPNVKTIGISIVLILNGIMSFITHKCFIFLVDLLTYKYVFCMIAGNVVIHGIYVKMFIPETKGMTLQDIQKMLNGNIESNAKPEVNARLIK